MSFENLFVSEPIGAAELSLSEKSNQDLSTLVDRLLLKRNPKRAIELCEEQLDSEPKDGGALLLLASCFRAKGDADQELRVLAEYCQQWPRNIAARCHRVMILARDGQQESAYSEFNALKRELVNPSSDESDRLLALEANLAMESGFFEDALAATERQIQSKPDDWRIYCRYGSLLHTLGDKSGAIKALRTAIKNEPDNGLIYWTLANIKSYQLSDEETGYARILSKTRGGRPEDLAHVCFALGKTYEDRKDFSESFRFYEKANDVQRRMVPFDAGSKRHLFDSLKDTCDSAFFKARHDWGAKSDSPIFIVGLPRVGSTLVEQILGSHSEIDATSELSNIINYARKIAMHADVTAGDFFSKYASQLAGVTAKRATYWGERYLVETKIRRGSLKFFTDKMPSNFWHIPLIQLILPNAKVIDIRRHPMSAGLGVYKQCLPAGHSYSNHLESIGENYRHYVQWMDHIDDVLPGKVHRVYYEDLVADTKSAIERMLKYLDLPFDPSCMEFHKNRRSIRTPSAEQVRQPIYTTAISQWRNFEPFLDPLKSALGGEIARYERECPNSRTEKTPTRVVGNREAG